MARETDHILEPIESVGPEYTNGRPKSDVNMLELCVTLARRKATITKFTVGLTLLAAIISLLLPVRYRAETLILPPQQNQSLASVMAGQLGMLAGLGKDLGLKNGLDLYVAMLTSESVEDGVVREFGLMDRYHAKKMVDARKVLESQTTVTPLLKEGLIRIAVQDSDPRRAADIANGYVDQLYELNQRLAITESSQRRLFYEKQLQQAKEDLVNAEQNMKQTQEKTGLLQLDSQARSIIGTVSGLKAEIATKEVQVQAMRSFATSKNPDLVLAETELAGLQSQLAKVLHDQHVSDGDIGIPTSKVPEASLAYIRAYRNVRYSETVYEILAKQYEAAKLDEAKSASLAQVVDPATVPERKSSPKRVFITLGAFLAGIILSCAFIILQEAYRRFMTDPENREQMNLLKSSIAGRF